MEDKAAYFVTSTGRLMASADTTRLDALPYYKRLWAKFSKKYRSKYIDIKTIEVEYINHDDILIQKNGEDMSIDEFYNQLNIKIGEEDNQYSEVINPDEAYNLRYSPKKLERLLKIKL